MSGDELLRINLTDVWSRAYPAIEERVSTIDRAIAELHATQPDEMKVRDGWADAHRLAGVLGTFGLARGTALARELERRLQVNDREPDRVEELALVAAELRSVIENANTLSSF